MNGLTVNAMAGKDFAGTLGTEVCRFHLVHPSRKWQGCRRSGFTLVEITVAIALSALLMVAMTGVLSGVAKQAEVAERYETEVWPSRMMDILRRDLVSAEKIWATGNRIRIQANPPQYFGSTLGTRTVAYHCIRLRSGGSALIRTDNGKGMVVAIGPTEITLERLDAFGVPQPLPPLPGPVPTQVRVWVSGSVGVRTEAGEPSETGFVRDLVLR